MKHTILPIKSLISSNTLAVVYLMACFAIAAQGNGVMVRYGFTETHEAEYIASGLRAEKFTSSPEIQFPRVFSAVSVDRNQKSLLFRDAGFHLLSKADVIAHDRFLTFSIEVESGQHLEMSSVYLRSQRRETEGEGAPSAFAVYAFSEAGVLPLGVGRLLVSPETALRDFQEHWLEPLEPIRLSGQVEIRIYLWTPQDGRISNERAFRLDEVSIFGALR
jgi:hypothetical protein